MLDSSSDGKEQSAEVFDLCIIGAGIAGLNALFVATQYLPKSARVVLIDRNKVCGGMWTETYDYVRLHQPHQMFTVGDMPWSWDRPDHYLATGREVQAHLASCLNKLRRQVNLVELFGYDCEGYQEVLTSDGPRTQIRCLKIGGDGGIRRIAALRTINAAGWDIPASEPLSLSSRHIISTAPNKLAEDDTDTSVPVVIVGGGKTGMDTAQTLLQQNPGRTITLIIGQGTVFGNRDMLFPPGARRWWQGTMVSSVSSDITMRFDGTNAEHVFDYFSKTYAISPDGRGERYFFSMMSHDEAKAIRQGMDDIVSGYIEDIVDTDTGPHIIMRDGQRRPVSAGSVIINCTGYLLRRPRPHEPYVSSHGTILTITTRSSAYPLSGTSAYFLTHVFFLDKLSSLPLYELDMDRLMKVSPKVFFLTSFTLAFYNMLVIMENVPMQVFGRCGLDLNRWYPVPRRIAGLVRLKFHQRKYMAHCRHSLDVVRRDYGIRCGPLEPGLPAKDGGAGQGQNSA